MWEAFKFGQDHARPGGESSIARLGGFAPMSAHSKPWNSELTLRTGRDKARAGSPK